ncbi:hypothetical protein MRB53_037629 [Persea americana]|nr:hypothetical protein MRB53_037629 [Persea americana]
MRSTWFWESTAGNELWNCEMSSWRPLVPLSRSSSSGRSFELAKRDASSPRAARSRARKSLVSAEPSRRSSVPCAGDHVAVSDMDASLSVQSCRGRRMVGFNLWLECAHIELGTNDSSNSQAVHLTISSSASQQSFSIMAYTDEAVRSKLSALNETQEEQEVVQQSKARKREDFGAAFSPIIADATATAYRTATSDIQAKLRRVVEVWRQRQIFSPEVQDTVEAAIADSDASSRSGGGGGGAKKAAARRQPVRASSKASSAAPNLVTNFEAEDAALATATLSPPVHAARLSALLKSLAAAENAVTASLAARQALLGALTKLVETHTVALDGEKTTAASLVESKTRLEKRKRDVEDEIVRGLGDVDGNDNGSGPGHDRDRINGAIEGDNTSNTARGGAAMNAHAANTATTNHGHRGRQPHRRERPEHHPSGATARACTELRPITDACAYKYERAKRGGTRVERASKKRKMSAGADEDEYGAVVGGIEVDEEIEGMLA